MQQKTLLSFFTRKVDKPTSSQSPVQNVKQSDKQTAPSIPEKDDVATIYQLVWAKLDGYPWWPALVCQDPDTNEHVKKTQIHVQFFDQPPSRAWVNRQNSIVPYQGATDEEMRNPKKCTESVKEQLKVAVAEADAALKIRIGDRDSLLVNFTPTKSFPCNDKENTDPPPEKIPKLDFDSDDSEDEYKPSKNEETESDDESSPAPSESDEQSDIECEDEGEVSKKRKKKPIMKTPSSKRKKPWDNVPTTPKNQTSLLMSPAGSPSTPRTPLSNSLLQKIAAFKSPAAKEIGNGSKDNKETTWPHLKLSFLQPEKIMDKNKRRPDHPEYDAHSLYVPEDFKNSCSPGMRQWWELKSDNYDTVLFFKVGKFYELYHMDACIGVDELSLTLMRGEFAHVGFPETAYGRYATILVQKGYKVARVEQMETPEMMNKRISTQGKKTKFDKVVAREVCQVTSKGTLSHNVMDGEVNDPNVNYLLALTEQGDTYGVCFLDVAIGIFHLGQFEDDKYLSRFRTLLSHCAPSEVIFEKKEVSEKTLHLFSTILRETLKTPMQSEREFWSASKTLKVLASRDELRGSDGNIEWPEVLRRFISPNDALGLTPADDGQLALRSLGACISYLQRSFLDTQVLSMKQFQLYDPVDGCVNLKGQYLILDDITLTNLEVLKNSRGGLESTLFARLDHCVTFPGKRLLRQWLCAPLADPAAIKERQTAVEELIENGALAQDLRKELKGIPDLERLVARIHSQGNPFTAKNHPDSRAIFFEEKLYSKRKIQDFLSALNGFKKLQKTIRILSLRGVRSKALMTCAACPDLSGHLEYFDGAFDHEQAKSEGKILPKTSGIDPEYDAAVETLKSLEKERQKYLKEQCAYFCATVRYFGTDKNRYQLEVPESAAKKVNSNYDPTTSRKGFRRYTTKETEKFLKLQIQAEEAQRLALSDLRRRIFAKFGEHHKDWTKAVECMATLDVFMSLAEYGRSEEETCVPEFDTLSSKSYVAIDTGRHPCIPVVDGFIPNSIYLGTNDWNSLVLLTGPNMGGKSTLLRQLGLHIILAHIGCRLPAASARLTPIDRVFTRIGAGDDILAGESTFYQEMSETGLIIQHSTERSVVLVDELGRGTSTYDGTAIAFAVVVELAQRGCLTLFSTHYHSLVEELQNEKDRVSLGHMACATEGDTITFLYQFIRGACPSSHGFHAARLAGLPEHIIKAGQEKAEVLELETERRKLFRKICKKEVASDDMEKIVAAISAVL